MFGTVRSRIGREGFKPLGVFLKLISLFFETALPYICEKIEERLSESNYPKLRTAFTYLCQVGNVLEFAYQFRYMCDD